MSKATIFIFTIALLAACRGGGNEKQKGITLDQQESQTQDGLKQETPFEELKTRPTEVVLTGHPEHRLVTVYKINYNKKRDRTYTGTNSYHYTYSTKESDEKNVWNGHFMPGLEALYGYNLLNIAHHNVTTGETNNLFEKPVLINTLYYPAIVTDTLNGAPVKRDYYLVSVYEEDTNQDSLINHKDIRKLYHFDLDGKGRTQLIPDNYSVLSSEYDHINDLMYIFARHDENENGIRDLEEEDHIFAIDLKNPEPATPLYLNER